MMLGVNDLVKVLDELYDVRDKWYDIGLRLNVPAETLKEIKTPDDNSCLRQVLIIWLKSGKATWTDLCQALRHRTIDQGKLADSLLAKYVYHTDPLAGASLSFTSTTAPILGPIRQFASHYSQPQPVPGQTLAQPVITSSQSTSIGERQKRVTLFSSYRGKSEDVVKPRAQPSDALLHGSAAASSFYPRPVQRHSSPQSTSQSGASFSFTSATAPTLHSARRRLASRSAYPTSQPQPVPAGQTLAKHKITSSQSTSIGERQRTVASFSSYRGKSEDDLRELKRARLITSLRSVAAPSHSTGKSRSEDSDKPLQIPSPLWSGVLHPGAAAASPTRSGHYPFDPFRDFEPIGSMQQSLGSSAIYDPWINPFHARSVSSMTPQVNEIQGVDMVTSTTVEITDKRETFTWKGYGLKMHVSDNCLPVGITQCKITIMVSIAGQYDFPENCHPVSAVFWLRCEPLCNFVKPVTIEMDHCAKQANTSKLRFVKAYCSQMDLPYTFRKLKEGVFNQHTSYGVVELHSFSGVSVVQEDSAEIEREYCAMLFYMGKTFFSHDFQIDFVVTWDTKAHLSVVNERYQEKQAQAGHSQPIEFESEQIELDIPMTGVTSGGWTIDPLFPPVIIKKKVDNFQPGKMIPSCRLNISFTLSEKTEPPLRYCVKLLGAKKPYDMFKIVPSTTTTTGLSTERRESVITNDEKPKLKDLLTELLTKVASKWENIGTMLDIEEGQLNSIKADQGNDSASCLRKMLQIWLSQVEPSAPTWLAMAKAIESAGDPGLARDLRAKYCRTNA